MTTSLLLLVLALALVAACGVFVAAEFSFVTVDRAQVEREAAAGDSGAQGLQKALRSLSTQLSGAQVGITVTNLAIGFLAEPSVSDLIDGPLDRLGVPAGVGHADRGRDRAAVRHLRDHDLRRAGAQEPRARQADGRRARPPSGSSAASRR